MDWDEARAKAPTAGLAIGADLSGLSIGELEARIGELEAEIARVGAELARKKQHEAAAAALFKT